MAKQPDIKAMAERLHRNERVAEVALSQCLQVNPDNPLAVAETIKEAFDVLENLSLGDIHPEYRKAIVAVLAKANKKGG